MLTSNKNKVIFYQIVGFCLITFFLAGCKSLTKSASIDLAQYEINGELQQKIESCNKLQNSKEQVVCLMRLAIENKNLLICDNITDNNREICYINIATAKQDISICNTMFKTEEAKESCYLEVALEKKDISICNDIKNQLQKDVCYREIAIDINDQSICRKIKKPDYKDECYYEVALQTDNKEICNKIQDYEKRDLCNDDVDTLGPTMAKT